MQYTGINGTVYETIEPPIGKGGEGSVYKIKGMPGSVLKVYSDKCKTETRHKKLQAMLATPLSQEAMQQVTWPTDVVYQNGQFSGYVMPILKNTEALNVMYSDKYKCSFVQRSILARNLCAAVNSVHNAGQVCGDLNPNNIKVDPIGARVTLIDTDSYHITDIRTQHIYRCEVGLPEYLPREVQEKMKGGYKLDNAPLPTFTKESDLFALAVHIFALLMNGCHPFACAVDLSKNQSSVVQPQPIENICNGNFPFYKKMPGITIPKYAPEFSMLPQEVQALFIRAFVNGHTDPTQRPSAEEWYMALNKMEQNVTVCKKNKLHEYPNHLNKCPWCELEQRMSSPVILPPVSSRPLQQMNTKIALANPANNSTSSNYGKPANYNYGAHTVSGSASKDKLSVKALLSVVFVSVSLVVGFCVYDYYKWHVRMKPSGYRNYSNEIIIKSSHSPNKFKFAGTLEPGESDEYVIITESNDLSVDVITHTSDYIYGVDLELISDDVKRVSFSSKDSNKLFGDGYGLNLPTKNTYRLRVSCPYHVDYVVILDGYIR